MRILKLLLAFVAAVIVTTILGAAFHTQFVIGRLTDLGIAVRFAGVQRDLIYVIAGAAAIAVALSAMAAVYNITPIAGARSWLGFMAQMAAGAVGGYVFALISRMRMA